MTAREFIENELLPYLKGQETTTISIQAYNIYSSLLKKIEKVRELATPQGNQHPVLAKLAVEVALKEHAVAMAALIIKMDAENKRLRNVLESIAILKEWADKTGDVGAIEDMGELAKQALSKEWI